MADDRRKRLERLERITPRVRSGPTLGDLLPPDSPAWAAFAVLFDPDADDEARAQAARVAHHHLPVLGH